MRTILKSLEQLFTYTIGNFCMILNKKVIKLLAFIMMVNHFL